MPRSCAGATLIVCVLLGACDSDDGHLVPDPDAAWDALLDAPFACVPVAPGPVSAAAPTCLALATSSLQGTTPFGELDVALDYFGAGDCITISRANIGWRGACGEALRLQFSYPVTTDANGRRVVTQSFDRTARFEFQPAGASPTERTTTIHVDVAQWQEGDGTHDIDITVTVTDPAYDLAPVHVQGTFCDWPYYLC